VFIDTDRDGFPDLQSEFGTGNSEDQYLVGDWDGDGSDNLGVRRGSLILMDFDGDSEAEREQRFGFGTE